MLRMLHLISQAADRATEPSKQKKITPGEFQADTFTYTFRLEETLAAANLPAWPSLDTQLFSAVDLRYSQTGEEGTYDKA